MKKNIISFLCIFLLLPFFKTIAATDGLLSTTSSTGSFNLNLTIGNIVQVSGLEDVNLNSFGRFGVGDLEFSYNVCVYTNNPSGNYRIFILSANGAGTETKIRNSQNGGTIPYKISWYPYPNGSGTPDQVFKRGVVSKVFYGANTSSNSCDNKINLTATINFKINGADLMSGSGGSYNDVITLMVLSI